MNSKNDVSTLGFIQLYKNVQNLSKFMLPYIEYSNSMKVLNSETFARCSNATFFQYSLSR